MKASIETRVAILNRALSTKRMPEIMESLASAARDRSPKVRSEVIRIISERRIEQALFIVEKLLNDRNEQIRLEAIACLRSLQQEPKHSGKNIQQLLRDRSFLVRIEALEALGALNYKDALPRIIALLKDRNPLVRAYSARAIAALGGASDVKKLQDALRREKQEAARAGFLEALLVLGNKEVFGDFLQLLHSADYRVRCAVANTLEEIPLDKIQTESAIQALSQARQDALAVADKTTVSRVLRHFKKTA